ncbi:MAG: hypothetical protein ABR511_03925 [Acidimicrobiales bacterium]
MSFRGTDVAAMMTRVEATLDAAERRPEGAGGVLAVAPEGDAEVNVALLRKLADIRVDFPPGSARPVVGAAVRLAKRTLRRAVRWYVTPMMEQQSRLNHALLDAIERLRVRIDRLRPTAPGAPAGRTAVSPTSTSSTTSTSFTPTPGPVPSGGRAVAVGRGAAALVAAVTGPAGDGAEVVGGDPAGALHSVGPGGVATVVADVAGLGPAAVVGLLDAAAAALSPGGTIVLGATEPAAAMHPRALAWALGAAGFVDVGPGEAALAVPPAAAGTDDRAATVGRLDAAARATASLLVARRGG